jgi:nucleotide-binding universal stress UspA family protein
METISKSAFKNRPPELSVRSGQPADAIIEAAEENGADLIVAGARQKEGLLKYYMGSVARRIARNAPCSVLLLIDPNVKPTPINTLHCIVDYDPSSISSIKIAAYIAWIVGAKNIYFTHTFSIPHWQGKNHTVESSEVKQVYSKQDAILKGYLSKFDIWGLSYYTRCLHQKTRYATVNFTREIEADLLVMPGVKNQQKKRDREFQRHVELILQDLPCSVLLTKT